MKITRKFIQLQNKKMPACDISVIQDSLENVFGQIRLAKTGIPEEKLDFAHDLCIDILCHKSNENCNINEIKQMIPRNFESVYNDFYSDFIISDMESARKLVTNLFNAAFSLI